MTGIRIYTGNNNPDADPVKYRIEGRGISGANIKIDLFVNKCATMDSYYIKILPCQGPITPSQKFELTEFGEIRVKNSPGYCLDGRYKNQVMFVTCYSDIYGVDDYRAVYHKWSLDDSFVKSGSQRIRSIWDDYYCLEANSNSYLTVAWCASSDKQFFSFADGTFESSLSQDLDWELISEGHLSWISEFDRNSAGVSILSTYERGDEYKYFMEAFFYENSTPYYEYVIRFTETRNIDSSMLQLGELELPGLVVSKYELRSDLKGPYCPDGLAVPMNECDAASREVGAHLPLREMFNVDSWD